MFQLCILNSLRTCLVSVDLCFPFHSLQPIGLHADSTKFLEADQLSLLSEGSAGHVDAILANQALVGAGDSALTGVFAVLAGVRMELLLHFLVSDAALK